MILLVYTSVGNIIGVATTRVVFLGGGQSWLHVKLPVGYIQMIGVSSEEVCHLLIHYFFNFLELIS